MNGSSAHIAAAVMGNKAPVSPIEDALHDIAHSHGFTERALEELEIRLSSVLRPEPPKAETASPTSLPDGGQSALHDQLLVTGRRVVAYNDRLQSIINRLVL